MKSWRYMTAGWIIPWIFIAAWPGIASADNGLQSQQPLTFVTWGGSYTRSQMLGYVRPYEKNTGRRIDVLDYNGGLEEIRNQVRALNVKWDVVDVEPADAIRGCNEGLFMEIDPATLPPAPDGTPARDDFIPGSLTRCAVGTMVWSTVFAYDTKVYPNPSRRPQTLQDFFDTKTFPGVRGLRRTPKANLEWALLADGVAVDNIYPTLQTDAGLQRAFSKLDQLKPHIAWWDTGDQAPRLLETGQVVMTSAYSGRIYDAVKFRDASFRIIWDHQLWNLELLAIPQHSRQPEKALDFLRFATSTRQLAEQARHIPYGPVRNSSLKYVEETMRPHLPTAQPGFEQALRIDAEWWAQHYERINSKFQQWLQRPLRVPRQLPH